MSLLPKFKKCPSCDGLNAILVNGVSYQHKFKSLQEWTLKKLFNCRKCKVKLGLFLHNNNQQEDLIWIDLFKCEDDHYDNLLKLEKNKTKYFKSKSNKKYCIAAKKVIDIQNRIRLDQVKLKVKLKIQKTMIMRKAF